jgi:hypothetical protein
MSTKVDLTGVCRTFYGTPPRRAGPPNKSNRPDFKSESTSKSADRSVRSTLAVLGQQVPFGSTQGRLSPGLAAPFGMTRI